MQLNELKAVLQQTRDVALFPRDIDVDLPYFMSSRSRYARDVCPKGLIRGHVLSHNTSWVEKRQIGGCGLQDFDITHKNGVKVRVRKKDLTEDHLKYLNRMTSAGDDEVFLVVSHKAIWTTWTDYSLKIAQMEKSERRSEERRLALREPQAEIMGLTLEELEQITNGDGSYHRRDMLYLPAEWRVVYEFTEDGRRSKKIGEEGVVTIPLKTVQHVLGMLSPRQRRQLRVESVWT